ncbi:right-handed parallel beta-helix repeat-containing protein [Pseudomonas azerbaijanoccidentalis]
MLLLSELTRRRFLQITGTVAKTVFVAGCCLPSEKSVAEGQKNRIPKNKKITELAGSLISADGGVNVDWASGLLRNALDCRVGLLSSGCVEVRHFTRMVVKKNPDDPKTWDWTRAIQAAIDRAETCNLVCAMPPGILRITAPLQVGSNSKLFIAPGTTILKDFNSLSTYAGTIMNKGGSGGVSNVLIFGGGVIKSNAARIGKHVVFFNSSFITVCGVSIRNTYSDWTTKFQNCNHVLIYGCDTDVRSDEVLTDGWHFKGRTSKIVIANNRVRTGDDCIAFTQEVPTVDEGGDIEDVTVVDNQLSTGQSSLIKIHVRAGISSAIRRISIVNSTGEVGRINKGGFSVYFSDETLSNKISNIKVSSLTGRCAGNGDYCGRIVGCSDIHITQLVMEDSLRGILVENSSEITLDRVKISALRGIGIDTSSGITLQNVDGFQITNPCISGTNQHGIQLGAPGKPVRSGVVSGGVLFNCASTGVRLTNCSEVTVEVVTAYGNRNGIVEDKASSNNRIMFNSVENNSITSMSLSGSSSEARGNLGFSR